MFNICDMLKYQIEDIINLTMYDMNDTSWSTNDMEFICNIIY